MPPERTTIALEGGGDEPQLTLDEMAAISKFHKNGYGGNNWSQKEKADLSSALNKAYGPGSVLRSGDFDKLRRWLEKIGFFK
jgi:hypothetical protein